MKIDRLHYKEQLVMNFRETFTVSCDNHKEHVSIVRREN